MFLVVYVMREEFVGRMIPSETAKMIERTTKQVYEKVSSIAFSNWVETNKPCLDSCASENAKPFQFVGANHSDRDQRGLLIWSRDAEVLMDKAHKSFKAAFRKFQLPLPPRMPFMVEGKVLWSTVGTMCV
jgi:hypothetical protein